MKSVGLGSTVHYLGMSETQDCFSSQLVLSVRGNALHSAEPEELTPLSILLLSPTSTPVGNGEISQSVATLKGTGRIILK